MQALGAIYLQSRGQSSLAAQVLAYAQSAFALGGRSISLSSDPSTYNMTYAAQGPFSGYAPYHGADAPDVLWPEGTAEVRLAASKFQSAQKNDPSSYLPGSAESSKALAQIKQISGGGEVTEAVVVFHREPTLRAGDLPRSQPPALG